LTKFLIFKHKHIDTVKDLWLNTFSENLLSIIGQKMIRSYLINFLKNQENKGFLLFHQNKMIAFVLFGSEKKIIKKIFLSNFVIIIFSFIKLFFFLEIKKIITYFNVLIFLFLSNNKFEIKNKNTELLIIVVDKNYQGKGFGQKLIKFSLRDNYFENLKTIYVKTLDNTNKKVKFYKKNGFKYKHKIFNRTYLELKT